MDFAVALKTMRDRLSLTQEQMALRLNCSVGTYRKWEAGDFAPNGRSLLKILEACPDDQTRALFAVIPPPKVNPYSVFPVPNSQEPPTRAMLMGRYRNVCIDGIELLYDLARGGSDVARDHLHSIAEVVTRMVGSLTRAELDDATRDEAAPAIPPAASGSAPDDDTPRPGGRRKPAH